jgi:hypothetical protein
MLEADALESLELKDCTLQHFGLVSKGSLCILRIKDAFFSELDIGLKTGMLEVLHLGYAKTQWPGLRDFLSKIPNLKELQFKGLQLHLKAIGWVSPCLKHLTITLDYDVMKGNIDQVLLSQWASLLEEVVSSELESTTTAMTDFVTGLRCSSKVPPA